MNPIRRRVDRSYLFVPGNRPERFDKSCAAGAHAVIVDLEDAVAATCKEGARRALAAWLSPGVAVTVRINAADSQWFHDDLRLCTNEGVAAIMLPKAEETAQVEQVAILGKPVLPLIETARGFAAAERIARVVGVQRLVFGSVDFQIDTGIKGDNEELVYFRSHLVLASRLAGRQPPVDGITRVIRDIEGLRAATARAVRLGFGGKICIHPAQVAVVNACFMPTDAEVRWAQRVIAASADENAISVDGEMIDRPAYLKAQRILGEAQWDLGDSL